MKYRKKASLTCRAAFTLIEIALSLGIASFALIGILGVIPIAVEAAKQSQDETRATFIASTIIETLRSGPESEGILQLQANPEAPFAYESIALRTSIEPVTHDLAYDNEGLFLGRADDYNYETGENSLPGTIFIARLTLRKDRELVETEVSVETPAIAPERNRKKYSYVTFLRP